MAANIASSLVLPEALQLAVQALAERRHQTLDALLLTAVQEFVRRHEQLDDFDHRDQLDRDTLDAWQDYEQTGLHLTQAEVETWLKKRAAGIPATLPECHR